MHVQLTAPDAWPEFWCSSRQQLAWRPEKIMEACPLQLAFHKITDMWQDPWAVKTFRKQYGDIVACEHALSPLRCPGMPGLPPAQLPF